MNADLRVGSLEETVTVTGESPVVDVQSATRQQVMNREVIDLIPTGRSEYDLAALIPGAVNAGGTDIGGAGGRTGVPSLRVHEGRSTESRHTITGAEVSLINDSGAAFGIMLNAAATEEVVVDVAAGDAESMVGGVRLHRIPREGGNSLNGTFFATGAKSAMQGNNLTQDLKDRGLPTPDAIDSNWNVNAGFGGPILRDRLWFFGAYQNRLGSMFAGGVFEDRNFNNPAAWTYDPDPSRPVTNTQWQKDGQLRLTWQATPRHKIGLTWMEAAAAHNPRNASTEITLEASEMRSVRPPANRGRRLDRPGYESLPDRGNRVPHQDGPGSGALGGAEPGHDWRRGTVDRVGLPCGRHDYALRRKNLSAYGAWRRTSSGPTHSRPASPTGSASLVSALSTSTR